MKRAVLALAFSGCAWWPSTRVTHDAHREVAKVEAVQVVAVKTVSDAGTKKATRTTRTVTKKPTGETIDVTVFDVLEGSWAHLATDAAAKTEVKAEVDKASKLTTETKSPWAKLGFCLGVVLIAAVAMWRILRGSWL